MENNITISKRIEDYLDAVDSVCNGFESKLIFSDYKGDSPFFSTMFDVNRKLKKTLKKFFESTRSLSKNDELDKIYNLVKNTVKEIEEKTLIDFDDQPAGLLKDKHLDYINDPYAYHATLFNGVKKIFKQIEGEINLRNDKSNSKTTTRIDSSHCIDVNSKFATALFELILDNVSIIKNMDKIEQGKILQKLTGYKASTYAKNFSNSFSKTGIENKEKAEAFLNPLLQQVN